MCGLLFSSDPAIERSAFLRALGLMHHRGPDADSCYATKLNCQLGHNRLSILDLDPRSNQPMYSRDDRYIMVYNGEIYNYRELAKRYGIVQRTGSDSEVVVELYALIGARMLNEFNGMFAIVILDTKTSDVFAARDRLGIKPLYYSKTGTSQTFSSELAPILDLYSNMTVDPVGLRQYRKLRTFFNGHTLYNNVSMFPAGGYLLGGKIRQYWSLPTGPQDPPSDTELRELITSAVEYRRISDVPVGSYLSGGLDSTIVAGLSGRPHTWTVGTKDQNEFEWASEAANHLGTTHHEVVTSNEEFLETAEELIRARREPLSVPNEVLLYAMTKEVKRHNTVILSGEGADELFFGYDRIFGWAAKSRGAFNMAGFDAMYSYGTHSDADILDYVLAPFRDRGSTLGIVASFFQIAHLHGLLRRLDHSTMRCSVEGRVPFVDHRLVERMAGVSYEFRNSDGITKAPLKRVFTDLVPPSIANRKKVGFPVDLETIFSGHAGRHSSPMDKWLAFNLKILGINGDQYA